MSVGSDLLMPELAAIRAPELRLRVPQTQVISKQIEATLERIERAQPTLNAFITVTAEQAVADARVAEQERAAGVSRGPLHGVPVGIKDLIATQGTRTTAGSRILEDWVPRRDASIVWMLRVAGAILVGKTNTHEFAFGTTNDNPHYGAARNPWNPALTTGGSSGGSAAAVASGLLPIALGTDTAGSIRIPAALCGAVGLKPTYGLLSKRGVIPLSTTLDTVGPIGRTVDDLAKAMAALVSEGVGGRVSGVGKTDAAPTTLPPTPYTRFSLKGVTIGVPEHYVYDRVDREVEQGVREALRALVGAGAEVRILEIPELEKCWEVGIHIVRPEALAFHQRWYPARASEYGEDVARSLELARDIPASAYLAARRSRRQIARALRRALEQVDLLAGPTVPILAFPNADAYRPVLPGGELPRHALTRLTYPFSLGRLPAITVPCALSKARLPIGLQLAAGPRHEGRLLAAARSFEVVRGPWPEPPQFFSVER
jgi:aspartyl-tRNA(Asn)/glutamyl-tRNA(Gln) amidotransferase subunit A